MLFDLETLRVIWWGLLGVLLIGFVVFDGFDLGAAMLFRFVGKTPQEHNIIIHTVNPVWEGNQVWLILAAGAIFAAWPYVYAVSFSGFYFAFFLALFTLILRPVGFKFRNKIHNATWTLCWDSALFLGAAIPSLVFGVAFGNLFLGAPFYLDSDLRVFYTGSFMDLFSFFPLLCGAISILLMIVHGSVYMALKTQGNLSKRSEKVTLFSSFFLLVGMGIAGIFLQWIEGYHLVNEVHNGPSNPLHKEVVQITGGWLGVYTRFPLACVLPIGIYFFGILTPICLHIQRQGIAFISSACTIFFILTTAGCSLFPFLLPSSLHPNHSLTVWDASSSGTTLSIMLVVTCIFFPCILFYTSWVYSVLRGKVTEQTLKDHY